MERSGSLYQFDKGDESNLVGALIKAGFTINHNHDQPRICILERSDVILDSLEDSDILAGQVIDARDGLLYLCTYEKNSRLDHVLRCYPKEYVPVKVELEFSKVSDF